VKIGSETVALVTGASRGIGVRIVERLAARGAKLVLAARSEAALEDVRRAAEAAGAEVLVVRTDVGRREDLEALVAASLDRFGRIDLLVNNAGLERSVCFEQQPLDEIDQTLRVNLLAPLLLTRLVLPGMLERDCGHVVNLASLAGLGAMAFGETYAATKHGVVGLGRSLRASLQVRGSAGSVSTVCPGFVSEVGMFADKQASFDVTAPASLGTSSPDRVARAVIRAAERNLPELVVNPRPIRIGVALSLLFPRLGEWLAHRLGIHRAGRDAALQ